MGREWLTFSSSSHHDRLVSFPTITAIFPPHQLIPLRIGWIFTRSLFFVFFSFLFQTSSRSIRSGDKLISCWENDSRGRKSIIRTNFVGIKCCHPRRRLSRWIFHNMNLVVGGEILWSPTNINDSFLLYYCGLSSTTKRVARTCCSAGLLDPAFPFILNDHSLRPQGILAQDLCWWILRCAITPLRERKNWPSQISAIADAGGNWKRQQLLRILPFIHIQKGKKRRKRNLSNLESFHQASWERWEVSRHLPS